MITPIHLKNLMDIANMNYQNSIPVAVISAAVLVKWHSDRACPMTSGVGW